MAQQLTWANEKRTLRSLTPWEHNPRYIKDAQAERLLESFNEFGQVLPICIAPNGDILDGHQRRSVIGAANEYGLDYEVDVRVASRELTQRERQKLTVYLHQGAAGSWDWEELANSFDFDDLVLWGFEEDQLLGMDFAQPEPTESADAEPQINQAAELLEKWQVKTGDLWAIGDHRLVCGDCTDAETVARVMGGEKAEAIVTDPPYSFGLASTSKLASKSGGWHDMMNNASWFTELYRQWQRMIGNGPLWVFTNWRTLPILMRASFDSGVNMDSVGVWYKDWIGPGGPKGLRPTYELIAFSALGDYSIPDRSVEDFFKFGWSSHKPTGHSAEKPAALIQRLIDVSSRCSWFEPFAGSGTTIVACQNLQRKCRAIEISPAYCSVILQRMTDAFPHLTIERIA